MNNYFSWKDNRHNHLSVGAVVVNEENKICCHHFAKLPAEVFETHYEHDIYLLMRETVEPNESLEAALDRGLLEEFGMKVQLKTFLGSILCHFTQKGTAIEKTTLYFLCEYISDDVTKRRRGDAEARSRLEWHEPDFLIARFIAQASATGREDVDESAVVKRAAQFIGSN